MNEGIKLVRYKKSSYSPFEEVLFQNSNVKNVRLNLRLIQEQMNRVNDV